MYKPDAMRIAAVFTLTALAACGRSSVPASAVAPVANMAASKAAQCVLKDPRNAIGTTSDLVINGVTYTNSHRPDAPSPLEMPAASRGPQPAGACNGNTRFRFGAGLYDTTGPLGGNPTGHGDLFGMVVPPQVPKGIDTRLFARAFAIESPCNGKRVMFVSTDLGAISNLVHQEVLRKIGEDAELASYYHRDNIMLSATHTHSAGGGFGVPELPDLSATLPALINNPVVWLESLVFSNAGFDKDNFNAIVDGNVQAIRRAHANLEAHPQSAAIRMSVSQLLNASINRSVPAYKQNAPSERAQYLDAADGEVNVNKHFLQLSLVRDNGSVAGVLNWFALHPTSMGNHDLLISADNKGYASLGFEKIMGTRYLPETGAPDGADNFVAAFAQADEGDTVPDLFVFDADPQGGNGPGQGAPYYVRGGTDEPYEFEQPGYELGQPEASAVSGIKQLSHALKEFGKGAALSGPVDYRFFYADFSAKEVTDPVVLANLRAPDSPEHLYEGAITTCKTALGFGFATGGVNGPGPGAAGYACPGTTSAAPYKDEIRNGYNGLYNGSGYVVIEQNNMPVQVPVDGNLLMTAATPVLCQQQLVPVYSCHNEKAIFTPSETNPVPFQIFRIGNLAILGVPFEVTTMGGRRLRKVVLDALNPVGVDTVVISGLSNDYLHYLATREEYSAQMYEGASTYAGPWQLAATQQEARKLALSMAAGEPAPEGPAALVEEVGVDSPITVDAPGNYGALVTDAQDEYAQGALVDVSFVAGYPGNDLKTMSSYLYVERQNSGGGWDVVATDRDPELRFLWNSSSNLVYTEFNYAGPSTAQALWRIPSNAPAGVYRIRHEGVSRTSSSEPPTPYQGLTRVFQVSGIPAECP